MPAALQMSSTAVAAYGHLLLRIQLDAPFNQLAELISADRAAADDDLTFPVHVDNDLAQVRADWSGRARVRQRNLYLALLLVEGGGDQEEDQQEKHHVDQGHQLDRHAEIGFLGVQQHGSAS